MPFIGGTWLLVLLAGDSTPDNQDGPHPEGQDRYGQPGYGEPGDGQQPPPYGR